MARVSIKIIVGRCLFGKVGFCNVSSYGFMHNLCYNSCLFGAKWPSAFYLGRSRTVWEKN